MKTANCTHCGKETANLNYIYNHRLRKPENACSVCIEGIHLDNLDIVAIRKDQADAEPNPPEPRSQEVQPS